MPIGNVSKEPAAKRETFRPPWVRDKDAEAPPPWTQRRLKPVDAKPAPAKPEATKPEAAKPEVTKPEATKPEATKPERAKAEPAKSEPAKPAAAKPERARPEPPKSEPAPVVKPALRPVLKKQTTVRDKDKAENGVSETVQENLVKPSAAKQADKAARPPEEKPRFTKSSLKANSKAPTKVEEATIEKTLEKPTLKSVRAAEDKNKDKSVTIVEKPKVSDAKTTVGKINAANDSKTNDKKVTPTPKVTKPSEKNKIDEKEEKTKMATKPPTSLEKSPSSKLPPRRPSLQKQLSKDEPVKKWRDPLLEKVKENIDSVLNNEVPKGHTLTKNESLRSLLKPTPPPMPPPMPPKMPPPPEFKKAPLDPEKLKKLDALKSRPRRRPDWSDMMKEVEEGKKLKKVVCNDRSSPIITRSSVVMNKGQFIFESEKPNAHNDLLKEINKGVRLKKTKTNDRSKPNLDGLRKFRRQLTIEEQVQKSMSQANLAASPSGVSISQTLNEVASVEEDDIDEMDDIDKVRDDLQSTKQLLAMELRNKEAQERENKRLLTKIRNLEAELARERALIKQEQHKTVISVTDAYDERLVTNLKNEVDRAKEIADNLEKKYLEAAEERDTAQSELEEVKRKNSELERKLEQAISNYYIVEEPPSEEPLSFYQKRQLEFEKECRLLNIDANSAEANALRKSSANKNIASTYTYNNDNEGIIPSNAGSRRSSHAIKQLSVTKDDSFEEEEESEEEEEESEEKKQKRMEKEVKNSRNKIRHLKEKQDNMKRERSAYKMQMKNQQACLKDEKRKYKELKREVEKMAAMMKEVGSDEEAEEEESDEDEEEKKSESDEESETETEQDTESETESESEPEDAPLPKKKENLTKRLKRHEARVHALKKGNALLVANVDRLKDDVLKQREESGSLQKELDSLIEDL